LALLEFKIRSIGKAGATSKSKGNNTAGKIKSYTTLHGEVIS